MARKFTGKERKEMEETMNRIANMKAVYGIPPNAIRSIEELAKLRRIIKGLGLGYLSRSQIKWLESGGYEALRQAKPYMADLIKELKDEPGTFPVSLRDVADRVQERIREKARKGELDKKWERAIITPAEVDSILRFKRDPYFSKGEKIKIVAENLIDVLEKIYKEEKARTPEEEPDVKVALEVAKEWLRRFMKASGVKIS